MATARSLDTLLGKNERHATFHDALLVEVHVDYSAKRFVAETSTSAIRTPATTQFTTAGAVVYSWLTG